MVSERGKVGRFLRQLGQDAAPPATESSPSQVEEWISKGGVAANGMRYAPPCGAVAWGSKGCPLLPKDVREMLKGVRLPRNLQESLCSALTVDQLDAGVLEGVPDIDSWRFSHVDFRYFLYNLPIPNAQVAIPAGIPLAWIESLPIAGRTRSAVQAAFKKAGTRGLLREPIWADQFLGVRSVGLTALNDLKCVIESAELGWTHEDPTFHPEEMTLQQNLDVLQNNNGLLSFNNDLSGFAKWAMAETDAKTFGEAIAELLRTGSTNEAWKPVAGASLSNLAASPAHPYEVLDNWMAQIELRSKAILMGRVTSYPQNLFTLEELSSGFGVTRERIRQIEIKARASLNEFLASDDALSVRWRASTIRQMLRVAAPAHTVEHLLTAPPGCHDHRGILLELAGPYDLDDDWLILRSARANDPMPAILTGIDEVGRIDRELATSELIGWGMDISLHERWLTRDPSVRLFHGQLVRWGASIPDRLVFALHDLGRRATIEEMVNHVGENGPRNSINNALAIDTRLVRVSPTHWALASWSQNEYSGIAESMRNLLEGSGGAIDIDTMVHQMQQMFGVKESSTRAYRSAPMFIVEEDKLRLRTQKDGPYRYDPGLMKRKPGVFHLGTKRLGHLIKVDKNVLRGSGTALTHAAGSILEVEVNARLSFGGQHGDKVEITFPETSTMGPSIGSVRLIAERLSAKEGDYLTLVLDRSEMTFAACVTDLKLQSPGWDVIGRLTGITSPLDLETLAKALHCDAGEVRSLLRARGDKDVLSFLPNAESSATLDDALAELEGHIENAHGSAL